MKSGSSKELTIRVIQGSILDVDVQVIVNAANSHGLMGGGCCRGYSACGWFSGRG